MWRHRARVKVHAPAEPRDRARAARGHRRGDRRATPASPTSARTRRTISRCGSRCSTRTSTRATTPSSRASSAGSPSACARDRADASRNDRFRGVSMVVLAAPWPGDDVRASPGFEAINTCNTAGDPGDSRSPGRSRRRRRSSSRPGATRTSTTARSTIRRPAGRCCRARGSSRAGTSATRRSTTGRAADRVRLHARQGRRADLLPGQRGRLQERHDRPPARHLRRRGLLPALRLLPLQPLQRRGRGVRGAPPHRPAGGADADRRRRRPRPTRAAPRRCPPRPTPTATACAVPADCWDQNATVLPGRAGDPGQRDRRRLRRRRRAGPPDARTIRSKWKTSNGRVRVDELRVARRAARAPASRSPAAAPAARSSAGRRRSTPRATPTS